MSKRAAQALKEMPPVPQGYPRWVKFFVDGGYVMEPKRRYKRTRELKPIGVYWSMRCENGDQTETIRKRDTEGSYETNNDAEWLALREALQYAVEHHQAMPIIIYSDSQLVVKQFNDEWKTKTAKLHRFRTECRLIAEKLKLPPMVVWVPRDVNVAKLGH